MFEIPVPTRIRPLDAGPERDQLASWLEFYRATLLTKCAGLSVEHLIARPVSTSDLTLLGLLRHMTIVEQYWFEVAFCDREVEWYYESDDDADVDFHDLLGDPLEEVVANFATACERSKEAASGHELATMALHARADRQVNLRWIYLHMIEEYARHCGHADLLREMIDGSTGV